MKNCILRAPLAALPLAVLATFSSHAQTVASSDLPETMVTATRFTETLASLPMGVSVITADQIRATGASTVNEAVMKLLGVPGRQDSYGGGDYALDLRGFGTTSDSNQVVVLDGVRLNEADLGGTRLAGIPIDSVERIEVLRGSGSVLYGEGATGGVIVITTKAGNGSARRNSATLYGAVGSNALRELRANATVASGGFSLDLHGQRRETDNHRDNFRSETDGAGFTAQWSNDSLRLGLRHDRDALDTGLPGSLNASQYASNPRQTTQPNNRASIRNERSGVFAEAMLGNWQLGVDAGSRDKALTSVRPGSVYAYEVEATQLALKARHTSQWGAARNALVIGHDRGEWDRVVQGTFGSVADQTARGWYLKDDLTLASGTRLSAGVRSEKLDKNVDDGFSPVRLSERETAWELGVSQPLSITTTVWGRVGNSFRLANVDEFSFTNPSVLIRPQTSRDLEAGMRWAEGAYKLEARLYRSNLTDEIGYDRNAPGPFGSGANVNFDPTRRQGLEVDGDWKLSSTLSLGARFALRRSTLRGGANSGKDVPLAPRRTLALRADWVPLAGHRLSGGVNFVGSQHPDFANVCRMPAYTTADARYAVQVKNMELSFGVNNLFDRDYYTQAFGCAGGQTTSIYPEAGRTFTAALRVSF
ncbi:MAG: TonB-dependent receptor [Hydrogenophaga sp.]|uniref:TonB-dependent receptor n=1 Tax=Hydrogenophaga sp. TaxID=1904254 RepID=UPI0027316834|nr:TonB-dependent receptor [Hydrogenophaga sp.]MDP1687464.1 TonB-dependent receptor [Hydrogenophaga sp.]MDP3166687.1 TonB-dependent receptor [Hydrogenophaga sp.]